MTDLVIQYLEQAADLAMTWGPLLILFFMAVESSFIPFPSEVVMIPAGFMAARSELFPGDPLASAVIAILCGIAGSLAGAGLNYYLALKLGRPFLYTYGKYFFLSPHALHRAEELFREYGDVTTFVCRLLPAIRQLISIPAGLSRMRISHFLFFTGLGAGLWVTVLTGMGYYFGTRSRDLSYEELVHHCEAILYQYLPWIITGCIIIFLGYMYVHKRIMKSKSVPPQL